MRIRYVLLGGLAMIVAGFGVSRMAVFGASPEGARRARMERSPRWKDGQFENPQPLRNDLWLSLRDFFGPGGNRTPSGSVPTESVDPARFDTPPPTGLRVTWLGHSTLLVELDGRRVLIDPVWGERAFPFSWLGPRRFFAPPLPLDAVPAIDAVVISHDHFDHLDMPTIQAMRDWNTTFVVSLGVGAHLVHWGVPEARIVELDWWERTTIADLEIVATPARHASGRLPLVKQNETLWAGFAFLGPTHRVYYSGDTGFFPGLVDIGTQLGPFDLAMIEAGAYGRGWPDWHLGPEQAVNAAQLVQAKALLPVHWGLFNLAYHGWTEPAERVLLAAGKVGLQTLIPKPGQSIEPTLDTPLARWWPELPWKTAEQDPIVATWVTAAARPADNATP